MAPGSLATMELGFGPGHAWSWFQVEHAGLTEKSPYIIFVYFARKFSFASHQRTISGMILSTENCMSGTIYYLYVHILSPEYGNIVGRLVVGTDRITVMEEERTPNAFPSNSR